MVHLGLLVSVFIRPSSCKDITSVGFTIHSTPARVCSVAQSCATLCDPLDCNLSSVHGILLARILEWVAISFSRASSWGLNPHLLHWQADSLSLSHLGSPHFSMTSY